MAYRVDYAPGPVDSQKNSGNYGIRLLMTLTVFALFLFCVRSYRPDAWTSLQEWIWPGDAAVTHSAAKVLWTDLQTGKPVAESVTAFCRDILYHAGVR